MAREVAHRLQNLRKAAGLEISDRVRVGVTADSPAAESLRAHGDWLAAEVLATQLEIGPDAVIGDPIATEEVELEGARLRLIIARA